jgi:hypothetical protein
MSDKKMIGAWTVFLSSCAVSIIVYHRLWMFAWWGGSLKFLALLSLSTGLGVLWLAFWQLRPLQIATTATIIFAVLAISQWWLILTLFSYLVWWQNGFAP